MGHPENIIDDYWIRKRNKRTNSTIRGRLRINDSPKNKKKRQLRREKKKTTTTKTMEKNEKFVNEERKSNDS